MGFVKLEMNGSIATLTLTNPEKLNSLCKGLVDELVQALRQMREGKCAGGAVEG